jgi:hypothetical protein
MKAASQRYAEDYKNCDQNLWEMRSQAIIQQVATELKSKYLYLPDLLQDLALERRSIAEAVHDPKAKQFGSFCTETMDGSEVILVGEHRREEVIPIVEGILLAGKSIPGGIMYTFKNHFIGLKPSTDLENKRLKAIWASDVLHDSRIGTGAAFQNLFTDYNYGFSKELSTLYKSKNGDLWLRYRPYNRYDLVGDYFAAQALYDDLVNWDPQQDLNSYLTCAAKFSYLMAHGFFVRRGTAAMVEWIIRGIAKHHGLKPGDFKEDALGWPWRALTTPNLEDYITWFVNNSFIIERQEQQQSPEDQQQITEVSDSPNTPSTSGAKTQSDWMRLFATSDSSGGPGPSSAAAIDHSLTAMSQS